MADDTFVHPDPVPVVIWKEFVLVGVILAIYAIGQHIKFGDPYVNARNIWGLERQLGIAIEPALQAWVLTQEWLVTFLAWYYMPMHLIPFLGLFLWHLFRRSARYPYFRAAAVSTLLPGLLLYSLYPLAPPRLLTDVGVVDLVGAKGAPTLTTPGIEGVANHVAAFPSEHVIWAVVVAWALVRLHDRRWLPFAIFHVVVTCFGVVAMGHHFIVDVVAGLLFAALAVGMVDVALLSPHLHRHSRARSAPHAPEASR